MRARAVAGLLALAVGACTDAAPPIPDISATPYAPRIDPSRFVGAIDNEYLPMPVGAEWTYESKGAEEKERIVVTVTPQTRTVMGVRCVVVRDVVSVDGEVIEDTFDWYAQDRDGNVWYFGEDTKELEDGKVVSTEGSWEGGVDGAQPGIVMMADPAPGARYRQEFYSGHAEDMAQVLRTGDSATVPFGRYEDVLVTEETTPLEPGIAEHKYYARGVGMVLEVAVAGGTGRVELVSFARG